MGYPRDSSRESGGGLAFGVGSKNLAHETVEFVYCARAGKEHKGALARHDANAVFWAECDGFLANRTSAAGAVHPDAANARGGTVGYYRISDLGSGHEQHGIDRRWNVLHPSDQGCPKTSGTFGFKGTTS